MLKKNLCQICKFKTTHILDLKDQPPANSLHKNKKKQIYFPLKLCFCKKCSLTQLTKFPDKNYLFKKYFWVTATSKTANNYAKKFYKNISYFLKKKSNVFEIASNDGTFLREFKHNGHKVLGIDPAFNIAKKANLSKIKTIPKFFNYKISSEIKKKFKPDLIFARNVIPHVSELNSVVKGISNLSSNNTIVAIEFHYAGEILKDLQYDSIYHEHIYYFSIESISKIFKNYKLYPFDIFFSPISAGSIVLIFSKEKKKFTKTLVRSIKKEKLNKINKLSSWQEFAKKVTLHKKEFRKKILKIYEKQGKLCAYGASARSSTLLNYTDLNNKYIDFIIDQNNLKNGFYTPGTNILINNFSKIKNKIKNYKNLILLAWNFEKEIKQFLRNNYYKGNIILPYKKK
ncbi:MAG: methyltransferase domain-containing protein [Pelagibacteraceae bacterium TMED124]|nr:hypothetical protein [Candidatus Neomarinimicrobiota bacterium]RPG17215.1 MAG: methyltransferase domain-containing protein [Pelagibacteraceae bacterium TMED124]|tara:strand:- start:727 stop:1926 length:1200 start_codon:yes stop_codon:yes gene_type:complete